MMTIRDDHVFRAKLAQQTNRFDIMVDAMKLVVKIDAKLTEEERDLLSAAYKNAIEKKCSTFRTIKCFERKVEFKGYENRVEMTKEFRVQVEQEIREICYEIIELLDQYLIPAALTVFAKAFYFKMRGYYYKCLSEFSYGKERNSFLDKSRVSYMSASNTLWSELRGDIDLLTDLYGLGEDTIGQSYSKIEDLSLIIRGVESYFKLWTDSEYGDCADSSKKWKASDFVLTL